MIDVIHNQFYPCSIYTTRVHIDVAHSGGDKKLGLCLGWKGTLFPRRSSILLQSARDRVATAAETVTACMFFPQQVSYATSGYLTNKLAANTHVIARKTQIAQCAAVNNWGDTWNIIRWCAIMF